MAYLDVQHLVRYETKYNQCALKLYFKAKKTFIIFGFSFGFFGGDHRKNTVRGVVE